MSDPVPGDPFAPAGKQAALLQDVRDRARADAERHSEDLMERELPVVEEAEALGRQRLVRLGQRRQELVADAESALAGATDTWAKAERRLQAALAALSAEGVPPEQLALEALDKPMSLGSIATIFALATAGAAVGGALWLGAMGATIAVLVCLALATALGTAAFMPNSQRAEPARLSALRRERARAETELSRANNSRLDAARAVEAIPECAQRLAEGELVFVEELVSAYVAELFRMLPPGALADGRGLGVQRKPRLEMPRWAAEVPV